MIKSELILRTAAPLYKGQDKAGNESIFTVTVSNIDKVAPECSIKYSTTSPTNQDVEVVLSANEPIIVNNNGGSESEYLPERKFVFEVEDLQATEHMSLQK